MSKRKPKNFYVVWKGRNTGIFNSWNECKEQIHEFPDAKYKGFKTQELAEQAFNGHSKDFIGKDIFESELTPEQLLLLGEPLLDSIAVDGAWDTSTGLVEYQGVHIQTKKIIFKQGPFQDGTNNIVEFLALVHALAYCKKNKMTLPIYTDSRVAMTWIKYKKANTHHPKSKKNIKLFELVDKAEKWLTENDYENRIIKWETRAWGEITADYGRK